MLRAALTILGKDLRLRLRDRSVLLFALVVPLGLTLLFSVLLPDTEGVTLRAAVAVEDESEVARGFAEEALPALVDAGVLTEVDRRSAADARAAVEAGELDAAWILPAGFGDEVTAGRGGRIETVVDPAQAVPAGIAESVARDYATRLERVSLAVATAFAAGLGPDAGDDGELTERIADRMAGAEPSLTVVDAPARDAQLDMTSHLSAGMAAFFVFFTVQFGVLGLLEERQLGTLSRILAGPVRPVAVQLGKALGALLLGLASMAVLAVAGALALDARWGPPGAVALLIVTMVLASLGVMALVGSFARTAEQAGNAQAIVAVVLGMLGGSFFPLPLDTGPLALVRLLSPQAWFLRGLGEAGASGAWTGALPAAGALALFAVATTLLAVPRLRRTGP